MDDYALKREAMKIANIMTAEVKDIKPVPIPRSLDSVVVEDMQDQELERDAPNTGYPELDRIIKGFLPGHLYTLTGVENVGKTSLACNFAIRVARQPGRRVLYIALEPENTVVRYLASVHANKRFDELEQGDYLFEGLDIDVLGKKDVANATELVEIIQSYERYDLVIIDHIGYFITSEGNYLQQQSNTIKALAGLTKEKRCAILQIAHLRKRPQGQKKTYVPTSDDIAGSGAFKQDSTEVMIVTRSYLTEREDEVELFEFGKLYVTKTKAGPNGAFEIHFSERNANITTAEELDNIKLL